MIVGRGTLKNLISTKREIRSAHILIKHFRHQMKPIMTRSTKRYSVRILRAQCYLNYRPHRHFPLGAATNIHFANAFLPSRLSFTFFAGGGAYSWCLPIYK